MLDKQGKAYVILPADKEDIRVDYGGDPGEVELLVTSEPQPHPEEQGWFERMTTTLKGAWDTTKDAADWTWGALQGDFNEDATIGQIATNAIITAIPVVDQVGDVRDITANIKLLVWDKRYKEAAIWFALVVTLVGLIPTFGSLLKGVFKLIWKGAKLDEVLALFNYFMKGNGVSWLKELKAGKLKNYIDEAAQYGHTIMDKVAALLTDLKSHVPQKFQNIHAKIQDTLNSLQTVKGQINAQFAKVGDELGLKIGKMLDEGVENSVRGSSRRTLTQKQVAISPTSKVSSDFLREKDPILVRYVKHPDFGALTEDEAIALYAYTSNHYISINPLMRSGDIVTSPWGAVSETASEALNTLSKTDGRVHQGYVYRGISLTDEEVDAIFGGDLFIDQAFFSTAAEKSSAFEGNVQIKAYSKTGVIVQELSMVPSEKEDLFKPGTPFKIISVKSLSYGTWEIFLSEI